MYGDDRKKGFKILIYDYTLRAYFVKENSKIKIL